MAESLKIVIPMAGWGTRMRPHTWSKPKPLVAVAGRTALDHLIGMFATVPEHGIASSSSSSSAPTWANCRSRNTFSSTIRT